MVARYKKALIISAGLFALIFLFRYFHVGDYFTLDQMKEDSQFFKFVVGKYYLLSVMVYIAIVTLFVSVALPIVGPLSVLAGFLFGVLPGFAYALIGSILGATTSFLLVRYATRNFMHNKYGNQLARFNERLQKYGYSYLLTLHLLMVPYFIVNTLAALANVPLWTFILTTVLGSIPFVFVYALAGRQLNSMESFGDIVNPEMILLMLLFAALALLPMAIRKWRAVPAEDDLDL